MTDSDKLKKSFRDNGLCSWKISHPNDFRQYLFQKVSELIFVEFFPPYLKNGERILLSNNANLEKKITHFLNDKLMLEKIELISNRPMKFCFGKIIKYSQKENFLDWHTDFINEEEQGKKLGFSLCLNNADYDGGHFLFNNNKEIIEHKFLSFFEIVLFDLNKSYYHKVNPVTNGERVVFSGWFY